MDTGTMLKALQDPMGIPFYPLVFQVLMVLTFALHILFVNFTLGTSFYAVYGHFKKDGYWKRLSRALARAVPANLSMAMLLGIAPLLFVQVIYDPFWYTSNTLSAVWVIAFVLILMVAYGFTYIFYLKRESHGGRGYAFFGIVAVLLFFLAGAIMHGLGYQLLQPEKWFGWYIKGGRVDASGSSLHAFQLSRFIHFIVPSFALAGIFLMLYSWYFKERTDFEKSYLAWVGRLGAKTAFLFTALQAAVGFWWLLSLPQEFNFHTDPFFLIGAGLGLGLLFLLHFAQNDPVKYALPSLLGAFLTLFGMSYARESLRMKYVGRFHYSIFDYKLNIDWGSTILFLGTFLMGLVVVAYLLSVAYHSGRQRGFYEATPSLHKLGKFGIALLVLWIVVVAGLGVFLSIKNYLL
ncbi:MAG: hypothetical protein N3G78_06510 [Desulfobacterota bacterium]|nr:hypothetical protein [Thermodesulfobacteriota bacterium]